MRIPNEAVRNSRTGDEFHYLWAARRCLKMVLPNSDLEYVTIEGPDDEMPEGEYVIDIAEYYKTAMPNVHDVIYIQCKHTVVNKSNPFELGDLKDTIAGFAQKYKALISTTGHTNNIGKFGFQIVTNRTVSQLLKDNFEYISKGKRVDGRTKKALIRNTLLSDNELRDFCSLIVITDHEGDFEDQRHALYREVSSLLASPANSPHISSIKQLVSDKALPTSDNRIKRVDILNKLGVYYEKDFLPAPSDIIEVKNKIIREQHDSILKAILTAEEHVIIHAAGGVGKSVFAQQLIESLPEGSFGFVYDCFGNGSYRNPSQTRHLCRIALVQIVNELSAKGLCDPLIYQNSDHDDQIIRTFHRRLETIVQTLRKDSKDACMFVVIDAADNAEIAARESNDSCFASKLLKEPLPEGCKLIELCRTERIDLLEPNSQIIQLALNPFSIQETFIHMLKYFPNVALSETTEFHRLTNNGNPRVQFNYLDENHDSIQTLLTSVGPSGKSIDQHIEQLLERVIQKLKDNIPRNFHTNIETICRALSLLPPSIPLTVLATVAGVKESEIVSFVTDLGRPLWISDTTVQFRDEPTETWFRKRFVASKAQIVSFINLIYPLANSSGYVATALPALLFQSGMYDELVRIALSDEALPDNNKIERRYIRVFRLQFAFKSSIKQNDYVSAIKLALLAGEEVAGDKRQMSLLSSNIDIVSIMNSESIIKEFAYQQKFRSGWDGSENIYSAALLASIEQCKGEAKGYLRTSRDWLLHYLEKQKQKPKQRYDDEEEKLTENDIFVIMLAIHKLGGIKKAIYFLNSWKSPEVKYRVFCRFIKSLIDAAQENDIENILELELPSPYMVFALSQELIAINRVVSTKSLLICLRHLIKKNVKILFRDFDYQDTMYSAVISFAEMCAANNLSKKMLLKLLAKIQPDRPYITVTSSSKYSKRNEFLRSTALMNLLRGDSALAMDDIVLLAFGTEYLQKNQNRDLSDFKEIVGCLLPWYDIRLQMLTKQIIDFEKAVVDADARSKASIFHRYRNFDILPFELSRVLFDILPFTSTIKDDLRDIYVTQRILNRKEVWIEDWIKLTRSSNLSKTQINRSSEFERMSKELIDTSTDGPVEISENYLSLARAVLQSSVGDAHCYFDKAVEAVSKFGDEVVQRWEASVALADKAAGKDKVSQKLAYRYIRCAELIGDTVDREKYWDRYSTFRTCVRLSPEASFAASSRWRERDVGRYNDHTLALAEEMVASGYLSPVEGWSMSTFLQSNYVDDLIATCLKFSKTYEEKRAIFIKGVDYFRKCGATLKTWKKLNDIASEHSIVNKDLSDILEWYDRQVSKDKEIIETITVDTDKSNSVNYDKLFKDLDLCSADGLDEAYSQYCNSSKSNSDGFRFWDTIVTRIKDNEALRFLKIVVNSKRLDALSMSHILEILPDEWLQKVSVKEAFPEIMKQFGYRFASNLVKYERVTYIIGKLKKRHIGPSGLIEGIDLGLADISNLFNANTYFGCVKLFSKKVTLDDSALLLDFALQRFEIYIKDHDGDGNWDDSCLAPENVPLAFAQYIWVALGSPDPEMRWRTMHCICELVELGAISIISELLSLIGVEQNSAYIYREFPFYYLHAKQYLLIALARTSLDHPDIVREYSSLFYTLAVDDMPHILIQKFSADIALNIEMAFSNTYTKTQIQKLQQIGISQYPMIERDRYKNTLDSPWHKNGNFDTESKFSFSYDFDEGWFKPLGFAFGIPMKQVEDLANQVVCKDWGIKSDGYYDSDPRNNLWKSHTFAEKRHHINSSYPQIEDYCFYLSYHSMLVVASKLLENMPVVCSRDWMDNEWESWLSGHLLTRDDGRWLSDRRDPVPIERSAWIQNNQNGRNNANDIYNFEQYLTFIKEGEVWINLSGFLYERDYRNVERISISSALVSPASSHSLLNALNTCSNPDDFKIPDFRDSLEFSASPFILKGWIINSSSDIKLDEFDPMGVKISYPPFDINPEILTSLNVTSDLENREWRFMGCTDPCVICNIWKTGEDNDDNNNLREGSILFASLEFVKRVCQAMNMDMIIKIKIDRHLRHRSYNNGDSDTYKPAIHKVYLITQDGVISDE